MFFLISLLIFATLCFSCSAEVALIIISKEQGSPDEILQGLSRYLSDFSHSYYSESDACAIDILSRLDVNYRPVIIYDSEKLEDYELNNLKEKRLIEEKSGYLLLSRHYLRRLTTIELIGREFKHGELGIFSMSLCPYGQKALVEAVGFIKKYNLPVDLKLYFIADYKDGYFSSLHGIDEVEENIHQLLIQRYWPDKLYGYFLSINKISRFQALGELGIPYNKIDSLRKEGEALLKENIKTASGLDISASPTFLWQNKYIIAGLDKVMALLADFKEDYYSSKSYAKADKIMLVYFTSPSCGFCRTVEDKILPELGSDFPGLIDVVKFDTSEPGKYNFMLRMEEYYKINKSGVPKIFIADRALVGRFEIEDNIYQIIRENLKRAKDIFPHPSKPIEIEYFYNSANIKSDSSARDIYESFIPDIEVRYRSKAVFKKYDISQKENFERLLSRTKELKGRENFYTPTVILDKDILQKPDDIRKDIDFLIQDRLLSETVGHKDDMLLARIERLSLPAIVSAGLLDGINPCAFTVIIFFISFLTLSGYRKKEMVYVGGSFIFAVFLAYLLIGIGLFAAFYRMSFYRTLADIMRYLIIAVVFLLAFLNIYDFIICRLKGSEGVILKLPRKVKFLIQKVIGKGYRKSSVEASKTPVLKLTCLALGVGFVVSVLESVCTGQVYFPTVAFIAQLPGMVKIKALGYLLLYNVMFTVPLIVIFLLGLWGVTSQQFAGFMKKNLGIIKLTTALLFIAIGVMLIYIY
ncbi:MAG: hypothetical protein PHQ54_03445 [Candidatus Omnitrophica bacterium]|nr:hypothetical protein [Candidatus Omnitrophota bacterium]